jgi:hypothetical protein
MISRDYRGLWCLMFSAVTMLASSSCTATPQQHLHGRWYNDVASIRFRPDGTLILNSRETGLATGRYYFDGETRSQSAGTPVSNLTMDLMLEGRLVRWEHEVQFLGDERLRLQPISRPARGRPSDGIASVLVLRKAADDGDALAASAPQ